MAHKLEKIYNAFGGLDTRSNKLISDPRTFRAGTKNMRYNFQDEIQKANGFQHKSISAFQNVGDIEYKYTDLDTGEAKIQFLCVSSDGNLYKKINQYLKFTSLGTATKYSFYYDETLDQFIFKFNTYAAITVSESMTLSQLVTAINAQGPTAVVVDELGTTVVGSTYLAYLIDCVIDQDLSISTIKQINSNVWELVSYPSQGNANQEVPFITTASFLNSSEYEGVSFINLNNVCYITDGGFPMKYDGRTVARVGMPKILKPSGLPTINLSGFSLTKGTRYDGGLTQNSTYKYVFQHGYVDFQGSEILGAFEVYGSDLYINTALVYENAVSVVHTSTSPTWDSRMDNFSVHSCEIDGPQDIAAGGGTINVLSGHNIKAGMILRIPVGNGAIGYSGYSFLMSKVSAVTATTITLELGLAVGTYPFQNTVQTFSASIVNGLPNATEIKNNVSGTATAGSPLITSISSTATLRVGDGYGPNPEFSAGTKILEIISSTQVRMSTNALSSYSGAMTFGAANRIEVGSKVTGTGIPANTTVVSINANGKDIILSNNATTTATSSLTFTIHTTLLIDGQVLNGAYAQEIYANKISSPNVTSPFCPEIPFGAFTRIYRSTANGSVMYKLFDVPLDATMQHTFIDDYSDTELSRIALLDAEQGSDLPRACKYLTSWQNQLVQAGRPVDPEIKNEVYPTASSSSGTNPWGYEETDYFGYIYSEAHLCDFQSIYWADALTPEGFPQDGLHEFKISTTKSDRVKGAQENKDALFAFKERSTGVITGSLADNDLNLEILEDDIGCANHRSIQQVNGQVVWLDASNGFYSCVAGRLPVNIGFPISDYQKINSLDLDYSKAVSANFDKENLYLCSVGTTTFVFDYADTGSLKRNCWYIWDRLNVKSLLGTSDDQLLLSDGNISWKMKLTNTKYDFTDHKSAIDFVLNTAWNTQGVPTVDKQYINLWVNSIQGDFTLDFSQYGNFLDAKISELLGVPFVAESSAKKAVKVSFKSALPKLSGISYGMRNNVKNAYVRLQGFEFEYSATYDTGEPQR